MQRRADRVGAPAKPKPKTAPVGGTTVSSRIPGIPWLVGGAIVVVVVIAALLILRPGTGGSAGVGAGASREPGQLGRRRDLPDQPAAGPARRSDPDRHADHAEGPDRLKVEADLSPIAAGNFVALASCGFYDGTPFHRTPTLQDGTPFVIQGGDPTGTGTGGPGYTIKDEPVTTPYKRGTVAMARSQRAELASARSSSSSSTTRTARSSARPTPTRSSAT